MGTVPQAQGSPLRLIPKGMAETAGVRAEGTVPFRVGCLAATLHIYGCLLPLHSRQEQRPGGSPLQGSPSAPNLRLVKKASQNAQGHDQAPNPSSPCPPTLAGNPESAELFPQTRAPFTSGCPASCLFPGCPSCMVGVLGDAQGTGDEVGVG